MGRAFSWIASGLLLLAAGCGKPLWYVEVPPETVNQKMLTYPNDETVSWWYAGSDGDLHHFVMKKESSWPHDGYRVSTERLEIRHNKAANLDFPADPSDWVQVGPKDLNMEASAMEKAVHAPDRVREKMRNLPKHSLDFEEDGGAGDDSDEEF